MLCSLVQKTENACLGVNQGLVSYPLIPTVLNGDVAGGVFRNGRRTCLPAPSPDSSNINLWNILRNNIGKDLSKVAMPVELNEPLNTLQHMCEELEYTELLDKAAETDDHYERMVSSKKCVIIFKMLLHYRVPLYSKKFLLQH